MSESLQELYDKYGIGNEKAELTEEEYNLGIDVESIINDVIGSRGENYEPVSEMETTRILDDIFRNDTVIPEEDSYTAALKQRTDNVVKKKKSAKKGKKKDILEDPIIKEIIKENPIIQQTLTESEDDFFEDEPIAEPTEQSGNAVENETVSEEDFKEVELEATPEKEDVIGKFNRFRYGITLKIAALPGRAKTIVIPIILAIALMITLYFLATVKIVIKENGAKYKTLIAISNNYQEIMEKATPTLANGRPIITKQGRRVTVNVITPFEITVNDGGKETTETTTGGTVSEVLAELGISLNKHDIISFELDDIIEEPTTLTITRVEFKQVTETENYEAEVDDRSEGAKKTVTKPGVTGVARVTYIDRYENGVFVSRAEMSRQIITEAQAAIILSLEHNGDIPVMTEAPTEYVEIYDIECTAYSEPGNYTATGKLAMVGYVAVDPTVIPYGTKMFICSADGSYVYGYAQAEDCGGAVKGNIVDLYMDTEEECIQFGRRQMIAYIIEWG